MPQVDGRADLCILPSMRDDKAWDAAMNDKYSMLSEMVRFCKTWADAADVDCYTRQGHLIFVVSVSTLEDMVYRECVSGVCIGHERYVVRSTCANVAAGSFGCMQAAAVYTPPKDASQEATQDLVNEGKFEVRWLNAIQREAFVKGELKVCACCPPAALMLALAMPATSSACITTEINYSSVCVASVPQIDARFPMAEAVYFVVKGGVLRCQEHYPTHKSAYLVAYIQKMIG
jgi:hypothetical protein